MHYTHTHILTALSLKPFGFFWGGAELANMTKGNRPTFKKRVKGACDAMPFVSGSQFDEPNPRSMKSKQRSWMLNGLKAMKAPMAPVLQKYVVFRTLVFLD